MKRLLLLVFTVLALSSNLFGQDKENYTYEFRYKKKVVVLYSFVTINDSVFMVGQVRDGKTGDVLGMVNINEKVGKPGTVSNRTGTLGNTEFARRNFKLLIWRNSGIINFVKYNPKVEFSFNIDFDLRKDEIIEITDWAHY